MLKHKYNKIKSYEKIPTNFGNYINVNMHNYLKEYNMFQLVGYMEQSYDFQ